LTNSSKELVYVLPWSTVKIAEISLSYLFTLRWLGTSALSHPVKKLYNSNIFQISALKMKFCTTILALALAAIACNAANVPLETSPKGFIEELTLEQQQCLTSVYHTSSCAVMGAMDACGEQDGGSARSGQFSLGQVKLGKVRLDYSELGYVRFGPSNCYFNYFSSDGIT
jgi:hypothetical protein